MPNQSPAPVPQRQITPAMAAITVLIVVSLASISWAWISWSNLADARDERDVLRQELQTIRSSANAIAYPLAATAEGPPEASGTVYVQLDGSGLIAIANLSPAAEGRSYQVWFAAAEGETPVPGQTFTVASDGSAYLLLPADVGSVAKVSISVEPQAGSTTLSGPIVLEGTTGGARG